MNLSLVCRLVIVFQNHAFFVERKLLFIASLHPSISATVYSCVDTLAVDRNCKTAIFPSFVRWAWACQPRPQLLTLRAWACLGTGACMNSEKYMNSKKIFSFYYCFLLVLQDALLLLSLHFFVSKIPLINYISILGHQVLLLYGFLLACSSRYTIWLMSSFLFFQMISTWLTHIFPLYLLIEFSCNAFLN